MNTGFFQIITGFSQLNTGLFQINKGFHQMNTGFRIELIIISISYFPKSLKDLKGVFIHFIHKFLKNSKCLIAPSTWRSGLQASAKAEISSYLKEINQGQERMLKLY